MLLDFYHTQRSKRYSDRRRAFVRKLAPKATPLRFAVHRREVDGVARFDEEEMDEFDYAEGWTPGVEWGWVGLPVPPNAAIWNEDLPAKSPARPTTYLSPSGSIDHDVPTPGLSTGSSATSTSDESPPTVPRELAEPKERPVTAESKRRQSFLSVKLSRRKSDAGVRQSANLENDVVPPLPSINAPNTPEARPLRRSRSSIEWGSREMTSETTRATAAEAEATKTRAKPAPAGRLSRWFGTTIKSIVPGGRPPRPVNPADQIRAPGKKNVDAGPEVAGERQEILYPCYYNNNE
ncbi:hypothetical protein FS749_009066 [Ceratobasidium sp. UAMH 11750]|nr:hypothetical protein FS749_009066 [Ceratobasidium sp. UAMH 11750]